MYMFPDYGSLFIFEMTFYVWAMWCAFLQQKCFFLYCDKNKQENIIQREPHYGKIKTIF